MFISLTVRSPWFNHIGISQGHRLLVLLRPFIQAFAHARKLKLHSQKHLLPVTFGPSHGNV